MTRYMLPEFWIPSSHRDAPHRLRPHCPSQTVIDFGLAHFSVSPEDRAVDLYVLERACGSAHSDISPGFFDAILRGYLSALSDPKPVAAKFEAVRQRGRKRLAFG